jgi:hypothetical protein
MMVGCGGEQAISSVRAVEAKSAAAELVDMSLNARGLRDDVTVIVVDVLPRAVSHSGSRRGFASTMGCIARWVTLDLCICTCEKEDVSVADVVLVCIKQEYCSPSVRLAGAQ